MNEPVLNYEFTMTALADTEGTIRATDTKASIGLVLHGLLFSGLMTITERLSHLYAQGSTGFRDVVLGLLTTVGTALLGSVLFLLSCIAPTPKCAIPTTRPESPSNFFLKLETTRWVCPRVRELEADYQYSAINGMDHEERLRQAVAELVKVSAIRARKIVLIRRGLVCLAIELVATLAFLGYVGFHVA